MKNQYKIKKEQAGEQSTYCNNNLSSSVEKAKLRAIRSAGIGTSSKSKSRVIILENLTSNNEEEE